MMDATKTRLGMRCGRYSDMVGMGVFVGYLYTYSKSHTRCHE